MKLKYIPNIITLCRLVLIAPFVAFIMNGKYPQAFYVFIIAGLSDGLDGWLARQFNWQTEFGGFIDPLADKLLVATSFLTLGILGQIPWWLVILVFARDITISIGVIAWYVFIGQKIQFTPTNLSKINTALQLTLVTISLFELAYFNAPSALTISLVAATTVSTLLSYGDYVYTWGKKAYKISN